MQNSTLWCQIHHLWCRTTTSIQLGDYQGQSERTRGKVRNCSGDTHRFLPDRTVLRCFVGAHPFAFSIQDSPFSIQNSPFFNTKPITFDTKPIIFWYKILNVYLSARIFERCRWPRNFTSRSVRSGCQISTCQKRGDHVSHKNGATMLLQRLALSESDQGDKNANLFLEFSIENPEMMENSPWKIGAK